MTPLKRAADRRLFLAELRAGRETALRRLRAALRESGGSPTAAARVLGIGVQTLYDARKAQPAVRDAIARHGVTQPETARRMMLARHRSGGKTAGSKKKSKIDRDPLA